MTPAQRVIDELVMPWFRSDHMALINGRLSLASWAQIEADIPANDDVYDDGRPEDALPPVTNNQVRAAMAYMQNRVTASEQVEDQYALLEGRTLRITG